MGWGVLWPRQPGHPRLEGEGQLFDFLDGADEDEYGLSRSDRERAEETMQVPKSMAPRIIGRKGITIRDIRQKSGATVELAGGSGGGGAEVCGDFKRGNCSRGARCRFAHGDNQGGDSEIAIRGSSSSAAHAKELILEVMSDLF